MAELTWEEKLVALQCLCDCSLRMREPGNWYVSMTSCSIIDRNICKCPSGNGSEPRLAVEDGFGKLTEVKFPQYIKARLCSVERNVRWGGFMWVDIPEGEHDA